MSQGEKLFYERCTMCHVAREPGNYTQQQWERITETMFNRASLNETEKKVVLEFLKNSASDAGK